MFYKDALWLTYYDWRYGRDAQKVNDFWMTHSRLRRVPLDALG